MGVARPQSRCQHGAGSRHIDGYAWAETDLACTIACSSPGRRSDRHFKQVFSEIRERFHPIVHHRQNRESKHDSYDRCTRAKAEFVDPIAHGTESRRLFNKGGAVPPKPKR